MPSGAKKRKAAKKKKEKEANITESATHSQQGDDDLKTHDEKESDGEVSSPTSQDHHNDQHPFAEGEEEELEKRENASSARSFVTEMKPIEAVNNDGESTQKVAIEEAVVQIDSNLKPEDDSESKNVSIEYVELSREGGSSSSSSSDDESHIVEKNIVVMESGELKEGAYNSRELTEGAYNSVSESATFVDSVKLVDSLSEVVTKVTDSVPVGEAYNSVVETATFVDSDKVSLSEEMVQVTESESVENFVTSDVVELGLKENGKKMLPSEDESTGVSSVMTDLGSQNKEDKVVSTPNENAAASSNAMGFAAQENEDKLLLSFNAPRVDTSIGVEHIKDSGIPESSDSQTQVASAPQAVQTTSWRSCCGLFEVLTGSNR
uniref:Putative enolase-phosphatase E1 n=1 Tax=Davidia involucrata TaxID=16924 RepID=A0A5B6Z2Y1_DAVIN